MEIIDTTLLKCYLKINDSLVAPLLRLKTNCCHAEETERALKRSQKYPELIIFYNTKEKHQEALKLLNDQSDKENSPLYGTAKTVQYLQNLGPEHINLVCEYAGPVLDKSPDDGLSLFTGKNLVISKYSPTHFGQWIPHRPILGNGFHTDPLWAVDSTKT